MNKDIIPVVREVAGELGIRIVRNIGKRKNVSEFKIADAMDVDIHQARNVLYKLHEKGLAKFIRKKDQKKGWYICYWTLEPAQIEKEKGLQKDRKLESLRERLQKEKTDQFYMCDNKCLRIDFEQAFGFEFKCPECGSIVNQEDNKEKIEKIEEEIRSLE